METRRGPIHETVWAITELLVLIFVPTALMIQIQLFDWNSYRWWDWFFPLLLVVYTLFTLSHEDFFDYIGLYWPRVVWLALLVTGLTAGIAGAFILLVVAAMITFCYFLIVWFFEV